MGWFKAIYRFDYMRHKKWYAMISGLIIVVGVVALFVNGGGNPADGLEYGLEFKTGTRLIVTFDTATELGSVRDVVTSAGYPDAVIQEVGDQVGTSYQIQTESLGTEEEAALRAALDSKFGIATTADGEPDYSASTVSPSFGRQVKSAMWRAGLIALVLILIYVTIRFEWKFAVGAIAAELHDLLIVVCVYSLVGREVTTGTLAAILTILGYSLYDTVIVYDRIRENAPKMSRTPYTDIVNKSIWQTLTRSINTTLLVLIPVACLLIFGGVALGDFAFALFVGVVSGAYSSIFVASPVLVVLKEREPQYRKLSAARAES
jgi:SecD/SecF fusion protein